MNSIALDVVELDSASMQDVNGGFDPVTVTLGLGLLAIAGAAFMVGYAMGSK